MKIIPAILVSSEIDFKKQVTAVQGHTDLIHLDVADGTFVPEKTWADPAVVKETLKVDCELHLMVADPITEIKKWRDVPQVKRIIVHHATIAHNWAIVAARIHELERQSILVAGTTIPSIELKAYDGILFMGVEPGGQGRPFDQATVAHVAEFKQNNPQYFVQVDGGMNEQTIPSVKVAGADAVCVGSAIFGHGDPAENLNKLKTLFA